ncbi:hypothetical protein ACQB60_44740 [Actinomycetota bacterium Odt1-20B]
MPRPEKDIPFPNSALGHLAVKLRGARARARAGYTYSQLEALTSIHATTLQRAAAGLHLPTYTTASAYYRACGQKGSIFELWQAAHLEDERDRGRGPAPAAPRLDLVRDRPDFSAALVAAHARHGAPSLRVMEQRAEARSAALGTLSRSAAQRLLARQAFPTSLRMLYACLHAIGVPDRERPAWKRAFRRAERAHQDTHAKNGVLARLPQREAEALLAAYGLEPAENYRGARAGAWTSRCLRCRQVQRVRLTDLEQGEGGCRTCPPRP